MTLQPSFFEHLEDRLNLAVTDINMGISEIRERVGRALSMTYKDGGKTEIWHDGDRDVELPAMVSDEEVVSALTANLNLIDKLTKEPRMSSLSRLKEKALKARQIAPNAAKEFEADLDALIAQEAELKAAKDAAVGMHKEMIDGVKGEIDGVKSAIDVLGNGGPPL